MDATHQPPVIGQCFYCSLPLYGNAPVSPHAPLAHVACAVNHDHPPGQR